MRHMKLSPKARAVFVAHGKAGAAKRNAGKTKKQLSEIAKRGWETRRAQK